MLFSGDIGREDEDGYLFVVDRLKELIKYKGYQVAPASLEDVLLHHDAVADVGVVGLPDEEAGELPRAYVVKKAGKEVTEEQLVEFVNGKIMLYSTQYILSLNKSIVCGGMPTLVCHGSLFYLKFLVKKGHNSKNIAFRVKPLALQLCLVMSKYSKFGVDNTF